MRRATYDVAHYGASSGTAHVIIAADAMREDVLVVDDGAQFFAHVRGNTHTSVPISPGTHSLYFITRTGAHGLVVDAVAGKTYLLLLEGFRQSPTTGRIAISVEVKTVTRSSEFFDHVIELIRTTPYLEVDQQAGDELASRRRTQILDGMRRARAAWVEGGDSLQSQRRLAPDDGIDIAELSRELSAYGSLP